MFLKSRKKIVFTVMAALTVFLILTLATIYGSNYFSLKKQNMEMLERYVSIYSLESLPGDGQIANPPAGDGLPGELPPLPPSSSNEEIPQIREGALYQLSSFYSAAVADDGSILAVDIGSNGIYSENKIISMAEEILRKGEKSGLMNHLLYLVDVRDDYTLVAFMDETVTESSMDSLFLYTLIVGLISIIVFLVLSVFLANRIILPLEENDKKQRQFVSDAEHELKTPIAVIGTNAELLSREISDNQWLANIRYENERMAELVKNMLDLSHAENGKVQVEEIDYSNLVEREVLPFESVAFEHGLSINSNIEYHIFVQGNRQQLDQLVSILTDNAISHASGGNEINIELRRDHRQAVLCISNPGNEIPKEQRSRLFDRFYRCDEARNAEEGHFGLGLPIAKAIVDAHNGDIKLDCREGRIIFTVSFPVKK